MGRTGVRKGRMGCTGMTPAESVGRSAQELPKAPRNAARGPGLH